MNSPTQSPTPSTNQSRCQSDTQALKSRLRAELRARRRGISEQKRAEHDSTINELIIEKVMQSGASRIGAYWSFDGEPNLQPALALLESRGIEILLPVLSSSHAGDAQSAREMFFHQWRNDPTMRSNNYGIPEPSSGKRFAVSTLDLLFMPLVGWSKTGKRLGMGAGYYDQSLEEVADRDVPVRIGVAYHCQQAMDIPTESWDIPLHQVLTEKDWFTCAPRSVTIEPYPPEQDSNT